MQSNRKSIIAYVSIIFSMIFWGISFVWTKELLNANFPVFLILTIRLAIASLLMFSVFKLMGKLERIEKTDLPKFFLLALFEPFLYFIGENFSMHFVDASFAAIMIALLPIVNPIALHIFNKDKIGWNLLFGAVISVIGIMIMSINPEGEIKISWQGTLLLLLAVFAGSGYSVILSRLINKYNPITITTTQNIVGILYFLPCLLIFDLDKISSVVWTKDAILSLVFLAIFCSAGAFMLYSYSAKLLSVIKVSIFTNAIPVVTIIVAIILGQELFSFLKVLGILIVVSGLLLSQFGFKKRRKI
ncbi:MAG: DMT family transporter [Bacteroidales bacterium]|jgi:drug/metabolite transporter (DMT)-like permease|nr:DMT family transporter [Bacteroidales bacterium]MEE0267590.1 DMT family transporter [Bacteroidales bacterium]MEE0883556.1 DMT family transporter [Bacteroidales bacterium]MEE1119156.1 DMT family transporter [Bacteroidales bacterium]MEE1221148.1 DMT family transporter [Bacteroidales bacterium]